MARAKRGKLEVICGPMFAGKTTALMSRLTAARAAGCKVIAIKPTGDTRSGAESIRTHTDETFPAVSVADADQICEAVGSADVVGIDEAHFFSAELATVCRTLVDRGTRVLAAGVDFDHRGTLFDVMSSLIDEADEVERLKSICAKCGNEAAYTQRLVESEARIVVGGSDAYEPRCNNCFESPKN